MALRRQRTESATFGEGDECCICFDSAADTALLPCKHFTCSDCLPRLGSLEKIFQGQVNCPVCRSKLTGCQKLSAAEIRSLKQQKTSNDNDNEDSNISLSQQSNVSVGIPSLSQSESVKPSDDIATDGVWCKKHNCRCQVAISHSENNKGRAYYRCTSGERCYFIIWAEPSSKAQRHRPVCTCDEDCVVRMSKTEKNPNRPFYCCPRSKCQSFAWAGGPTN